MADGDNRTLKDLAVSTNANGARMEYHPSIRALVRYLARRAAEADYNELLEVMEKRSEQIIDDAGKDTS